MAHFEVKSRRTIIDKKTGNDKSLTEIFFIQDCVSWADAEDKMLKYFNNENEIVAMSISKVVEVVNTPLDSEKPDMYVFRAIMSSIFTDEVGREVESKYPILVWAKDVEDAMVIVNEYIKQGYDDLTLTAITKTKIVEVI